MLTHAYWYHSLSNYVQALKRDLHSIAQLDKRLFNSYLNQVFLVENLFS